jgi:hypothetical protein
MPILEWGVFNKLKIKKFVKKQYFDAVKYVLTCLKKEFDS